jgi:Ubiquitin carboxyl-terminal hydrolase
MRRRRRRLRSTRSCHLRCRRRRLRLHLHLCPPPLPPPPPPQSVGLVNLGNTCYISSGVQCVSHTPLLTDYFLSGAYTGDINPQNKMGAGGELARVYAVLVRAGAPAKPVDACWSTLCAVAYCLATLCV